MSPAPAGHCPACVPSGPLSILMKTNGAFVTLMPLKMDLPGKQSALWAQLQSIGALKAAGCECRTALVCPTWPSAALAASGLTQVKRAEVLGVRCLSWGPPALGPKAPHRSQPFAAKGWAEASSNANQLAKQIKHHFQCKSITVLLKHHRLKCREIIARVVFFFRVERKDGKEGGGVSRYPIPLESSQDSNCWRDLDRLKSQSAGNHIPQIMCYCF